MALVNVDVDKAGIDAVDEAAKVLVPALDPLVQKLLDGIKGMLIGRTITITIS